MKYQVLDYLLKPINKDELYSILKQVDEQIEETDEEIDGIMKPNFEKINIDQSKCSGTLKKLLRYIDKNYNKDISLIRLSEFSGLHSNYICALFKKELGMNYLNYLNIIRLKKAIEILGQKEDMTVSHIAEELGYQSERQFFRMFKHMTGITPKQYREKYSAKIQH